MSNSRTIRKVTLNVSGLKGLTMEGTYETLKENKLVINSFKDGVKAPIHSELESKIADLRVYALEICGLTNEDSKDLKKAEKFQLLHGTEVLSFEFEEGVLGWIKIKCSSRVFSKFQAICTPKIDMNDGYEFFEPMMTNLAEILVEVDLYTKGLKKVTDEEIMMSYVRHGKDKNVDISALNDMSAEERADYCQLVLEKLGCLVIRPDEVTDDIEEEVVSETLMLSIGDNYPTEEPSMDEVWEATKPEEDSLEIDNISPEGIEELRIAEPIKLKK